MLIAVDCAILDLDIEMSERMRMRMKRKEKVRRFWSGEYVMTRCGGPRAYCCTGAIGLVSRT